MPSQALTSRQNNGEPQFVPNIGYFLSIAPALLLAILQSPLTAFGIVLLYTGAHWTNDYLVIPLVQRRAVHLPPGLTIAAQLFLGMLLGGLGLLVATPLVAVLLVVVKMVYIEDTLGEPISNAGPALVSRYGFSNASAGTAGVDLAL